MKPQDISDLFQFLAGYWYDRNDEDEVIVAEFVGEVNQKLIIQHIDLIKSFIDSDMPAKSKEDFIRKAAWRWFPEDVENSPVIWLKKILALLEKANQAKYD